MHLFHYLTTWFLVLLFLLQRIQGDQRMAKDCLEYTLNFNGTSNRTPSVALGDALEVSLQVANNKGLPVTQIVLYGSKPSAYIRVSEESATLSYGNKREHLTLVSARSPFSWINLVLDPISVNTLLVYTPTDRLNAITANVTVGSSVYVSSNKEAHVTFNCLSGCLIRDNSSALIGGKAKLQPPFTMYVNPIPRPPPVPLKLSITPVLTLTSDNGVDVVVNGSEWAAGKWHKVKILKAEEEKIKQPRNGADNMKEVQIWVRNTNYRISRVRGFRWTLHCAPEELVDNFPSTDTPDPGTNTDGDISSTSPSENGNGTGSSEGKEGGKSKRKGGAGAGMVTAWVMAGLALFLVLVLTLALCTKTNQSSNPNQFHDSQPSVGIVYCKGANREPEEDSEPESPNELKVPSYRNSHKQFGKIFKEVED